MTRQKLAHFFRPEADETSARHYVRKMLCTVRGYPWAAGLEIEKDRLRWSVDTDIKRLQAAASAGHFQEAIDEYSGPLLDHLDIDNSSNFEAWLEERREELNVLWQDACLSRAAQLESGGHHQQAASVAHKVLQNDSLAETALQSYVRNTYLAGNQVVALHSASRFAEDLERETGLRPLPETLQLINAITHSEPVSRITTSTQIGRRASDRPPKLGSEPQLEHLSGVLRDPNVRFLSINKGAEDSTRVLSLRMQDTSLILEALVNLAEQLASQKYYERSRELLDMVISSSADDSKALEQARRFKTRLEAHTSKEPLLAPTGT